MMALLGSRLSWYPWPRYALPSQYVTSVTFLAPLNLHDPLGSLIVKLATDGIIDLLTVNTINTG